MTTAADLITEASAQLHGWGTTQDRVTPLSAPMTPTDTTFTVTYPFGQSVGISPGVVEIESELVYVVSIDQATGIATVAPGFGRGYKGTTAVSHVAGVTVTSRPRFPRINLFNTLNEVISGLYPDLYAVGTYTGTITVPSNRYNLGSTIGTPMEVIEAEWQDPVGNWHPLFSYRIDPQDGYLELGSGGWVGRPFRVKFKAQPALFAAETDNLSVTGLTESVRDVLTLGIVSKVLVGLDISRAQLSSVEQSDRSRVVPPSAGASAAKFVTAEFMSRLANEAQSLRRQYKPRIVRTF